MNNSNNSSERKWQKPRRVYISYRFLLNNWLVENDASEELIVAVSNYLLSAQAGKTAPLWTMTYEEVTATAVAWTLDQRARRRPARRSRR